MSQITSQKVKNLFLQLYSNCHDEKINQIYTKLFEEKPQTKREIWGVEFDTIEKKSFLKTRFNESKENYRSPYSQQYFPINQRIFLNEKQKQIEKQLNVFLQHYAKRFYQNPICSAYFDEDSNNRYNFFIGILSKGKSKGENFHVKFNYQIESQLLLTDAFLDNKGILVEIQSKIFIDTKVKLIEQQEEFRFQNAFKNNLKQQYIQDSSRDQIDLIKIVGNHFEKSEDFLRNMKITKILEEFQSNLEQMKLQSKNNQQEKFGQLVTELEEYLKQSK